MNFEEIRNLYAFFNCSKKFIYMNICRGTMFTIFIQFLTGYFRSN